jgi:hypothetical protein
MVTLSTASYSTSPIDKCSYGHNGWSPYDPQGSRDSGAQRSVSEFPVHGSLSHSSTRPLGYEQSCKRLSDSVVNDQSPYHTDDGHNHVTDFVLNQALQAYHNHVTDFVMNQALQAYQHMESYPTKMVTFHQHYFLPGLPRLIRQCCDSPNTPLTCKEALLTSVLLIMPARTTSRYIAWIPTLQYLIILLQNTAMRAGTKLPRVTTAMLRLIV